MRIMKSGVNTGRKKGDGINFMIKEDVVRGFLELRPRLIKYIYFKGYSHTAEDIIQDTAVEVLVHWVEF